MKKLCIIYGHCLAVNFVKLLSKHAPFTDLYDLIPYYSTNTNPLNDKYAEECSLFIYQRASLNNPQIFEKINSNSIKIAYPFSTFYSLWPWVINHFTGEYNYRVGPLLVKLVQENLNIPNKEILKKYKNIDMTNFFNLDIVYEKDLKKFEYIDSFCDIKFLDNFTSIADNQYFFTVNHLSANQEIFLLQAILKKINCSLLSQTLIDDYLKIPQQMIPIHPTIIEHFKLKWLNNDSKYWCFYKKTTKTKEANYSNNEIFSWFTFDEYIENYIDFLKKENINDSKYNV